MKVITLTCVVLAILVNCLISAEPKPVAAKKSTFELQNNPDWDQDWDALERQAKSAFARAVVAQDPKATAQAASDLEAVTKARFLSGQSDLQDTFRKPLKDLAPQVAMIAPAFKAFVATTVATQAKEQGMHPDLAALIVTALSAETPAESAAIAPQLGRMISFSMAAAEVRNEVSWGVGLSNEDPQNPADAKRAARDAKAEQAGSVVIQALMQGMNLTEAKKLALEEKEPKTTSMVK